MRLLNTVYVTEPESRVTTRHRSIEIHTQGSLAGRFPLEGIEGLIISERVAISTETISRAVASGIRVALLSRTGRLKFVAQGPIQGNINLRLEQYKASINPSAAVGLVTSFVAGKLQNQRRLVNRWVDGATNDSERLQTERSRIEHALNQLKSTTDANQARGHEGTAARSYFKAMAIHLQRVAPEISFGNRTRRPPLDPTNALLSFCYSIATSEAIGALDAVGLDPQLGFLHLPRPGRPSLALDLVEEIRPIIDRFVIKLFARKTMTNEDFAKLPNGAYRLTDESRRTVLKLYEMHRSDNVKHSLLSQEIPRSNLFSVQATLLARTIRGDLERYPPYVMEA